MSGFCQSYTLEFSETQKTLSLHGSLIKAPTFTPRLQRRIFSPLVTFSLQSWGRGLSMEGRLCCNSTAHNAETWPKFRWGSALSAWKPSKTMGWTNALTGNRQLDQNSPHWLYSLRLWENICTAALAFYHKPSGINKKKTKGMNSHSLMGADDYWKAHKAVWRHKHAGSSVSC